MRTFLLLALTFVAFNATQSDIREIILDDIIASVNHVLRHTDENLFQYVKDIFPSQECSDNDICQAAKVMKGVHLKEDPHNLLGRNLFIYANITGHVHCRIIPSVECPVKEFLKKVKYCCQSLCSKLPKKTSKKTKKT